MNGCKTENNGKQNLCSLPIFLQLWFAGTFWTKHVINWGLKHLMTGLEGNSEFCIPRISMFSEMNWKSRETLRFEGNKILRFPRDQLLSDLLHRKTNNYSIDKWHATAVNISRVTANCFPFGVIVFTMLPARGIWRETVSLLQVMWPWTSQWMGAL